MSTYFWHLFLFPFPLIVISGWLKKVLIHCRRPNLGIFRDLVRITTVPSTVTPSVPMTVQPTVPMTVRSVDHLSECYDDGPADCSFDCSAELSHLGRLQISFLNTAWAENLSHILLSAALFVYLN